MQSQTRIYLGNKRHAWLGRFEIGVLLLGCIVIFAACRPALSELSTSEICTFAIAPTGEYLAVGGVQGIYVYRFSDVQLLWAKRTPDAVRSLTFSPDGMQLLGKLADDDVDTILLWESRDGRRLRKWHLNFTTTDTTSLNWSPDGKNIVLERDPDDILLLDAIQNRQYVLELDAAVAIRYDPALLFWSNTWSPDGRLLAFGSYIEGGSVEIWDVVSNTQVYVLPWEDPLFCQEGLAFDTTGTRIATTSWKKSGLIWEIETHIILLELETPPAVYVDEGVHSRYEPNDLVWSPDDKWLATGTRSGVIVIWDAATGKIARFLTGHTAPVLALSFRPDSGTLLSASQNEIIEWDVVTGEPRPTLQQLVTTP